MMVNPKPTGGWRRCSLGGFMLVLLSAVVLAAGCSTYKLSGTVIDGPQSAILLVDKNDSRLNKPGISSASLILTIDPDSLDADRLPVDMADDKGKFSIPIDKPGAGFLEYDVLVIGRASGYKSASRKMQLPAGNKRLLIVLSPGADSYQPETNILKETMEIGKKLAPGR